MLFFYICQNGSISFYLISFSIFTLLHPYIDFSICKKAQPCKKVNKNGKKSRIKKKTYQTVLDIPLLILPQQFLRKFCAGQFDRVSVVGGIAKIGKTCLRSFKWHVQFFFVWEKNLLKIKF